VWCPVSVGALMGVYVFPFMVSSAMRARLYCDMSTLCVFTAICSVSFPLLYVGVSVISTSSFPVVPVV